jgi:anaerobic magnesium-protoporphyrin IX monomethyl ester cyclase
MRALFLIPPDKALGNVVRDFVYGCWCGGNLVGGIQMPPLSQLYVATVLHQDGVAVRIVDAGQDPELYDRTLAAAGEIDVLVLLTSTNSFRQDAAVGRAFKAANPRLRTLFFGAHPTFMPQACMEDPGVDVGVLREAEWVVRDLFRAWARGEPGLDVDGIAYRRDGEVVVNPTYPFIQDLDELPIPDRSLLPPGVRYFNPVARRLPFTSMQTSRGCWAQCDFCTVPSFFGNKVRWRSTEHVLAELRQIARAGYREVMFRDETFTAHKARNAAVCQGIIDQGLDLTWVCNARVDRIDAEQVALMKRAGCHLIKFGVESGDQAILDRIRKGITLEQTRAAFAACHQHGVEAHAHVMLGCPGETWDTIHRTIRFVQELEPATASFGIYTPYPGTDVFVRVEADHPEIADGTEAELGTLHVQGFYNQHFTQLTSDDLERAVKIAYRRFYLRPRFLLRRARATASPAELIRRVRAASRILQFSVLGRN